MNRNNIWIHLCIAVTLITMAAVWGQIRRWQASSPVDSVTRSETKKQSKPIAVKRSSDEREPEVLVKFRSGVPVEAVKKLAAKNNDRVEDSIESVSGLFSIDDLDNADAAKVAEQYSAMTDLVAYAEPNLRIQLDPAESSKPVAEADPTEPTDGKTPNDPYFNEQWALKNSGQDGGKAEADLSAIKAWTKTTGSGKVVIAVLDTGVDYTHADLAPNMWFRPDNLPQYKDDDLGLVNDSRGFNSADNQNDPMDENGHGTHCAGIIGAEGNNEEGISGINWKVEIMPLKFLGRGGFGTTKDAIEAINYAVDRKRNGVNIRVISASWGSTQYSKALEDAIRAAGEAGILFVAAAGNSSTDNDKRPHYPSNYDLPNVISVAALDRNDTLASFSNFGAKTVHIAAPGREILSTWLNDDYREASGTSMATPYVSGTAALVLALEPNLKVEQLRDRLLKSVDKIDSLNGKVASGGRLNAAKAVGN
ncbi:MAG: S8 family serine peptidase [Acidobacteria bacterium]|nr:S8 family serine peptidase [Acidobacteriota bacterium]MBK8151012.1 S8 family serine peptidase [Acidobacteriota bacterium]MBK8813671.1 S8 family serine peptidase [Acidobacteriota bacterium]